MDETSDRPSYEPAAPTTYESEPTAKLGAFQRLIKMFTSPGEVFDDISVKPTWLVVLIAMMVLTVGAQAIILPHMDNEATIRARMGDRAEELSDEQIELRLTDFDAPGFDPASIAPVDVHRPMQEREPGGLGLPLIQKIADDVIYSHEDGNLTITVVKKRS